MCRNQYIGISATSVKLISVNISKFIEKPISIKLDLHI